MFLCFIFLNMYVFKLYVKLYDDALFIINKSVYLFTCISVLVIVCTYEIT